MRNKRKKHESSGNQFWLSLLTAEDNDCRDADQEIELTGTELTTFINLLSNVVEFLEDLIGTEEREFDA